jgi:DNA-directed RNA polymerase sigma subunit (sigma70/sigma32)
MELYMTDNTSRKLQEQAQVLQQMAYKIRRDEIKRMRKEGKTLSEIGKKYKITRERVRQILLEKD